MQQCKDEKTVGYFRFGWIAFGCSQEDSKGIKAWGIVERPPRILLSNDLLRPNSLFLDVQLNCNRYYTCKELDLRYHSDTGAFRSIHTQLELVIVSLI